MACKDRGKKKLAKEILQVSKLCFSLFHIGSKTFQKHIFALPKFIIAFLFYFLFFSLTGGTYVFFIIYLSEFSFLKQTTC